MLHLDLNESYESENEDYCSDNETETAYSNVRIDNNNDFTSIDMVLIDTLSHIQTVSKDPKEIKHFSDKELQKNLLTILKSDKNKLQKMHAIINKVYDPYTLEPTLLVKKLKKELETACRYPEIYAEIKKINDISRKIELIDQLIKITNNYFDYLTKEKIEPLKSKRFKKFHGDKIAKYEIERNHIVELHQYVNSLKIDPSMEKFITLKTEFNRWKSHLEDRIAKSSIDSLGKGRFAKDMQESINTLEKIFLQQQKDITNESKMRSNLS